MSMKYLGESFDIHTGGIDQIPVHHPNEIAQSEGATGKQFVRYWVHYNFLRVDGKKMSKSLGNFYTIEDVLKKGIDPLALRYFYLTSHYRKELNFTWEALAAAGNALSDLKESARTLHAKSTERSMLSEEKLAKTDELRGKFDAALANDMNTPQALAVVWEALKSNVPSEDKYDFLCDADEVLGLGLRNDTPVVTETVPDQVTTLLAKRTALRANKQFAEADSVRDELLSLGYEVEDKPTGAVVKKKTA
jgi:cysteinyl-tRNA synthetase